MSVVVISCFDCELFASGRGEGREEPVVGENWWLEFRIAKWSVEGEDVVSRGCLLRRERRSRCGL